MAASFIERETQILETVEHLSREGNDFVVVGGYAVSGLARHRFSVDLDIVVQHKDLERIEAVLERDDFEKHLERKGFDEVYGGQFVSYVKKIDGLPINVDLFVGSLVCRATNASWSFNYLKTHSVIADISGLEVSVRCWVPVKELLIASKMHSGRKADVRDVVVLMENADTQKVAEHLKRGDLKKLRGQTNRIIKALEDERLVNSLKGVFAINFDVSQRIEDTRRKIEEITERLYQGR
jgi:hypothetical protein